jgi:alpha-N-arabinofuranosidase
MAQLVNVIAPIMTEIGGRAWRQTIYHPFALTSKYGRGTALRQVIRTDRHDTKDFTDVNDVETASIYNEEREELTIFAVNRGLAEPVLLEIDVRDFAGYGAAERTELTCGDLFAVNDASGERVAPRAADCALDNGTLSAALAPASWNMLRLGKPARG